MNWLKVWTTIGGLAALVCSSGAGAQEADAASVVESLSVRTAAGLFGELGFPPSDIREGGNTHTLLMNMPGGGQFVSQLMVCDQGVTQGCKGLLLYAYFKAQSDLAPNFTVDYNARQPFARLLPRDDGSLVLSRYIVLDGGVTYANIAYNITNFLAMASRLSDDLSGTSTKAKAPIDQGSSALGFQPEFSFDAPLFEEQSK